MKATFNNIVDQLVKVLTDNAESPQYYSENEQYTGICDWCASLDYLSRLLIYYCAAVCAAPASAGRHLSVPKKLVIYGKMQESASRKRAEKINPIL